MGPAAVSGPGYGRIQKERDTGEGGGQRDFVYSALLHGDRCVSETGKFWDSRGRRPPARQRAVGRGSLPGVSEVAPLTRMTATSRRECSWMRFLWIEYLMRWKVLLVVYFHVVPQRVRR